MKVWSTVICAALAIGAAGCEKKTPAGTSDSTGSSATPANTGGGGGTPAGTPAASKAGQDTPAGAMRLFIEKMGAGDFGGALAYVDPACQLHADISKIVDSIKQAQERNPENSAGAVEAIKAGFAPPYRGAEASMVSEEGERAMVELKRVGFPPIDVAVIKGEGGRWFVSAPSEAGLFAPAFGGGGGGGGGGR